MHIYIESQHHLQAHSNGLAGYAQPLGAQPLGGLPPGGLPPPPPGSLFPPIPDPAAAQQLFGAQEQHVNGGLRRASDSFGSSQGGGGTRETPRQASSGGSDGINAADGDLASEVRVEQQRCLLQTHWHPSAGVLGWQQWRAADVNLASEVTVDSGLHPGTGAGSALWGTARLAFPHSSAGVHGNVTMRERCIALLSAAAGLGCSRMGADAPVQAARSAGHDSQELRQSTRSKETNCGAVGDEF